MTECKACGDKTEKRVFPSAVVEINNPEQLVLLRKVVLPATLTEADNPPVVGKYRNVILQYEDTGHIYLYSSDGIPTAIESNVPQEVLDRIADLESDLAYETSTRQTADTELGDRIDAVTEDLTDETAARETADAALSTRIDGVASAITAETTARQTADTNLQSQIDAITASSDVTDIVGTYAQLQAYDTSTLGDNDIIKVLQDESENDATTYYRWNTTTQQFTLIGEEGPYYTKSQADTLLNAKQNTLTAGSNVQIVGDTISATDTTYTAGTGLDLTGTTFSADTTVLATQTDLASKQDELTAGTGIDITNNVISATSTGPTVVQTTGTSTADVMSQNATTSMIFADPATKERIRIGSGSDTDSGRAVVIGGNATSYSSNSGVAIGYGSSASSAEASTAIGSGASASNYRGSVALGANAKTNSIGEVNIGTTITNYGYSSSNYRLLTGLYDPQSAHDAATKGYVDNSIPATFTTNEWNALWA